MEGIDREALDGIFPFRFKVGEDMTLLEVSPKLVAISPKMAVGSKVLDCLQFERPILKRYDLDTLLNFHMATIEIKLNNIQGVNFVGQIVQNQSSLQEILFLVKPFAKSLNALSDAGFTLSDFAPSDALPNLLLGIQFAETKSVQLKKQNELLREEIKINKFLSDIFASDTLETLFLKIAQSVSRTLGADDVIIYKVESDLARQAPETHDIAPSLARDQDHRVHLRAGKPPLLALHDPLDFEAPQQQLPHDRAGVRIRACHSVWSRDCRQGRVRAKDTASHGRDKE